MTAKSLWMTLLFAGMLTGAVRAETGTVTVLSEPSGCWVRVDSVLIGQTPLENLELSTGPHTITVFPHASGTWNIEERHFHITLAPGESRRLEAVFSAPAYVNSVPFGARVYQDTTLLGTTPLFLPLEQYGGRQLRMERPGYKSYTFTLRGDDGLLAHLERDEGLLAETAPPRFGGMFKQRHIKTKFSLLAVSVAAQWASFYFKNVADSRYDDYRRAADPQRAQQFWDETERFDTFSDVSLGISYASLAGLIYYVVWK